MLITAITIENFKGISEPIKIELKPITLLLGPNSSGKSTIVQAFHYAREIFDRRNLNPDTTITGGKAVNLGGFRTLIHNNDLSRAVRIRLSLDLTEIDLAEYFSGASGKKDSDSIPEWENRIYACLSNVNSAWVECSVKWDEDLDAPVVDKYFVGVNGGSLIKIERLTTSPHPSKVTLFPHKLLEGIVSNDDAYQYQYEEKLLDDYLCSPTLQQPHEDYMAHDHENELLAEYEEKLTEFKEPDEPLPGQPAFIREIEMFLNQDSALPEWDKVIEFVNPFWEDDIESEYDIKELADAMFGAPDYEPTQAQLTLDVTNFNFLAKSQNARVKKESPQYKYEVQLKDGPKVKVTVFKDPERNAAVAMYL